MRVEGVRLRAARASPRARLLAVGGEGQGNDLKLYDVETQKVRYKAKPLPRTGSGIARPRSSPRWSLSPVPTARAF